MNVPDKLLDCLNGWPEGTIGYEREKKLLLTLNQLCREHGYGLIPQLAQSLRELADAPEKAEYFNVLRKRRLDSLESYR